MRVIKLDGSQWKTPLDFLTALFEGIEQGYPHGLSINAFIDSMIWRGMGGIEPPYVVLVTHIQHASKEVKDEVAFFVGAIAEARRERLERDGTDVEVSISAPDLQAD